VELVRSIITLQSAVAILTFFALFRFICVTVGMFSFIWFGSHILEISTISPFPLFLTDGLKNHSLLFISSTFDMIYSKFDIFSSWKQMGSLHLAVVAHNTHLNPQSLEMHVTLWDLEYHLN